MTACASAASPSGLAALIGPNIRVLRGAAGLTQHELALKLGTTGNVVSEWERAIAMPNDANVFALAAFFGVSPADLFRTGPEKTNPRPELAGSKGAGAAQGG